MKIEEDEIGNEPNSENTGLVGFGNNEFTMLVNWIHIPKYSKYIKYDSVIESLLNRYNGSILENGTYVIDGFSADYSILKLYEDTTERTSFILEWFIPEEKLYVYYSFISYTNIPKSDIFEIIDSFQFTGS